MKILEFLKIKQAKKKLKIADFYQESIEKYGHDQIKRLAEKGLSIPVFML